MHEIEFSSLPILVNGIWVQSGFEGVAEVEIDSTGEPYIDRISLVPDVKGKPLVLKRVRLGQQPTAATMLFALIDTSLNHWNAAEIQDVARKVEKDELGYGPMQHERL